MYVRQARICIRRRKRSRRSSTTQSRTYLGHAIEAEQGYGKWLHGEAVATGMVLAAKLAVTMNLLEASDLRRIEALIAAFDLPLVAPEKMGFDEFIAHMQRDKKNIAGKLRFIVPTGIGQSEIRDDVTESMLQQIL